MSIAELTILTNRLTLENKKRRGQFYTRNAEQILEGIQPPANDIRVVEPFAGCGELIQWLRNHQFTGVVEAFDIEPKHVDVVYRRYVGYVGRVQGLLAPNKSTLLRTEQARNNCTDKSAFDQYGDTDLFRCFLLSLTNGEPCSGGALVLPAGFFFSVKEMDKRCRDAFMSKYRVTRVNYFGQRVFADTSTTVVAFSFERATESLSEQQVHWYKFSETEKVDRVFRMSGNEGWLVGGDIYKLPIPDNCPIKIGREVTGKLLEEGEHLTSLLVRAMDSGTQVGRIGLKYTPGCRYESKDTSPTFAQLTIPDSNVSFLAAVRSLVRVGV